MKALDPNLNTTLAIIEDYWNLCLKGKEYAVVNDDTREFILQHPSAATKVVLENGTDGHCPVDYLGQHMPPMAPGLWRLWDSHYYNTIGNARRQAAAQLDAKVAEAEAGRTEASRVLQVLIPGLAPALAEKLVKTLPADKLAEIRKQLNK